MLVKNSDFIVFGYGRTGKATVDFLLKKGADKVIIVEDDKLRLLEILNERKQDARILCTDSTNLDLENLNLKNLKSIVVSPGIPFQAPSRHQLLRQAESLGIKISSDLDLLHSLCPDATYIGITGTNGKSTTTALIGHILTYLRGRENVSVGGNIGIPVLNLPHINKSSHFYVIESSSFQLDLISTALFDISICLNITPDHLNRYGNLKAYEESKEQIFTKQRPYVKNNRRCHASIISVDNCPNQKIFYKLLLQHNKETQCTVIPISVECNRIFQGGVCIVDDNLIIENCFGLYIKQQLADIVSPSLIGLHNAQNLCAAIAACITCCSEQIHSNPDKGLIKQIFNAVSTFQGLPHRMQRVSQYKKFIFINDSKATNVASTKYALDSFNGIYWIAGGISKDQGIEALAPLFYKVRRAYLIGEAAENFAKTLKKYNVSFEITHTLENALISIAKNVAFGDIPGTVLLSPACASFDQWQNFEERGNAFIKIVENMWIRG